MTKEKQIEEMFNTIVDGIIDGEDNNGVPTVNTCLQIAEALYNEGYRKQIDSNWTIRKIGDGEKTRTCSNCHISQTVNVYRNRVMFAYCPYCGAKMKGE